MKLFQKMNLNIEECELKFSSSKQNEFVGYASVFGGIDSYGDTIQKGAYQKTIAAGKTIPMFINHDSYQIPVGKYVELEEDDHGLKVKGWIDVNHRDGPSLRSALKNKTMDGLSIGYRIMKGGAYEDEETGARVLTAIDLKEISAVNYPADDNARISVVKSELEELSTIKDLEIYLRDSGCSKSEAQALVSRMKAIVLRDSGIELLQNEIITLRSQVGSMQATDSLIDFVKKLEI